MGFLFKEELKIEDIEDILNTSSKQELIDFLIKSNAGSPKNRELNIDGKIYIFNNVLNFNKNAKLENVREYIKNLEDILYNEIPFGRDGFGNVYFVDLDSFIVRFYDHENDCKIELLPFGKFVKMLGE